MQINTDRNRLNIDWVAASVHPFLRIYLFIYGIYTGAYAFAPLPGYDQLLPIKNTTHADSREHSGAYAFVPLSGYD